MASIFTRIINRELPGRFVYKDDICVAFLTIEPLTIGHTLVVPRVEIEHWIDLDDDTAAHLMLTGKRVGRAIQEVYEPRRVGLIVAGLDVPHVHLHVLQIESAGDLDFRNANTQPLDRDLDTAMEAIHAVLQR